MPKYLVKISRAGAEMIYPARTLEETKEIMRWLQQGGYRTHLFRWSGKHKAYLS